MYAPLDKTWNYVFADDVSQWIINSFSLDGKDNDPINLVSSYTYTTREVLEIIMSIWPSFQYTIMESRSQTGQERLFDAGLREIKLGKERYNLREGLTLIFSQSSNKSINEHIRRMQSK